MSSAQGHNPPQGLNTRRLLRREITYDDALDNDSNMLVQLGYRDQKLKLYLYLHRQRKHIQNIVAHHLGISVDRCTVVDVEDWIHGSFNVCLQVIVDFNSQEDVHDKASIPGKQYMIRFPLPFRIGENFCPGNADEKVRCEAATYAWLQENCPTVSIPQLYGFGLSNGLCFTFLDNLPFLTRSWHRLRRLLSYWLGYSTPSLYVPHEQQRNKEQAVLNTPYLLIEYIKPSQGKMLSETWEQGRHNPELRSVFFHGLSRIMLALARVPLPKIGSFTLDDQGYLNLSNRPLTIDIQQLENEHIPLAIPRNSTHSRVESYIHDILSCHESRLRHQPNAINDLEDGSYQASALMVMRSIWPCFFSRDFFQGPFFLNLTDLNHSNIFVDGHWNITCLIDLEWACSHPVQMIHPPHWLTNEDVDSISAAKYNILHAEFMEALAQEEAKAELSHHLSRILQQGWDKGTFWCSLALRSPTAMFSLFYEHIQPIFAQDHNDEAFWRITTPYWSFDADKFLEQKLKDKEQYDVDLCKEFES
ncbi:uncharacterized protein N7459_005918 [Penicillium hispanicum]|uniref:uncharacterized protein n=1 Tax=Penicillium hispanicum TaxID=1080232 RepID=UPI00254102DD|nr:uncharacterized protein N7459_005918 [Penicillium hispanicum]KAJ5579933.1 hypothetical protein N7459_005918 [Penicillium hispanicum]